MATRSRIVAIYLTVRAAWAIGAYVVALVAASEGKAQDFTYTNSNGGITIIKYTGPGGNVTIPATIDGTPVTAIGGQAFTWSTTLSGVTFPDSVTVIEDGFLSKGGGVGAFYSCTGLTNVTLGNGITNLGLGAFAWCTGLTRVTVPDSVTTVGDFAFHFCTNLANVTMSEAVSAIGPYVGYAFDGCSSLVSVTVPGGVTNLADHTFSGCRSLTNATIENGVARIGREAFSGCTNLPNIILPASVTNITDYAFAFCDNLKGVYFRGNAPMLSQVTLPISVFLNATNVTIYYLPGTSGWDSTFAGCPTTLWKPEVQTSGGRFGIGPNGFGFTVNWSSGMPYAVEASTNLANPYWFTLQSGTLTANSFYFSDPHWTNYPERFYRIRSP